MPADATGEDDVASSRTWRSGGRLDLVLAIGALVTGSFVELYTSDLVPGSLPTTVEGSVVDALLDTPWTAWSNAWSIVPLLPLMVVVLPILCSVWAAVPTPPDRLGSMPAAAVRTTVGVLALLTVIAYLLRSLAGNETADPLDLGLAAWVLSSGVVLYLLGVVVLALDEPVPPPEPPPAGDLASAALLVTLAGALVAIAGSFLPAVSVSYDFGDNAGRGTSLAWGDGLRPLFALPAVAGGAVVAVLLLHERGIRAPLRVPWTTWRLAFSAYAVVASISILLGNAFFGGFADLADVRFGQWVMLAGGFGMLAGTLADRRAG